MKNINVIIRTSYRPTSFKETLESVLTQVYNREECTVNIIVGYDDSAALSYIPEGVNKIAVEYPGNKIANPFFYNWYLNALMSSKEIMDGHILFLDDDDILRKDSIETLCKFLISGTSYIFPFVRQSGFQKPTPAMTFAQKIHRGYIGLQNLVLSTNHRSLVYFGDTEDADYKAINRLNSIVKLIWVSHPLVLASDRAYGKMEDKK